MTPDPQLPLVQALLTSLQTHRRSLQGRRIWLACSGGRDSLSLAHLCQQLYLQGQLPFLPQLLHVHHGLQAANDRWAEQVQVWAKQQGMPCQVLYIKIDGDSEQAARQARYQAMMQVMNQQDVLMLAHHGDDQAETLLLRLFNGAGVTGLGGMREWRSKQLPSEQGAGVSTPAQIHLWRPWLSVRRQQITDYAQAQQLPYVDDPTNVAAMSVQQAASNPLSADVSHPLDSLAASTCNDRAWLRGVILPALQARFPQSIAAMMRSSQLLQAASDTVEQQARHDIETCVLPDEQLFVGVSQRWQLTPVVSAMLVHYQSVLSIERLLALPEPRQAAAIHQWLSPTHTDLPAPKRLVDEVQQLCQRTDNNHQTQLYWHSGQGSYEIRRYQDNLYRLASDWLEWLNIAPTAQYFSLTLALPSTDLPTPISLKSSTLLTDWQLHHLEELKLALLKQINSMPLSAADATPSAPPIAASQQQTFYQHSLPQQQLGLQIEPLPRQVAVTLLGRQGSKSGKKLLQTLRLPMFMRASVALCSLAIGATELSSDWQRVPLFLITPVGLHCVDGPFAAAIEQWLDQYAPVLRWQ